MERKAGGNFKQRKRKLIADDAPISLHPRFLLQIPKVLKKATLLAAHEVANRHLSPLKPLDEMDMAELLSYPKETPECQLSGVSIKVYKRFNIPVDTLDLGPVAVPFGNLYAFTKKKNTQEDTDVGGK